MINDYINGGNNSNFIILCNEYKIQYFIKMILNYCLNSN